MSAFFIRYPRRIPEKSVYARIRVGKLVPRRNERQNRHRAGYSRIHSDRGASDVGDGTPTEE